MKKDYFVISDREFLLVDLREYGNLLLVHFKLETAHTYSSLLPALYLFQGRQGFPPFTSLILMSDNKKIEVKNRGWNEWANKKNDWNISNSKRPKLDIYKNHLSQSSSVCKPEVSKQVPAGRGGSFRRTNSLPTKTNGSPMKEDGFLDVQEEFDAMEAKVMAEAAAAIEKEMAQNTQTCAKPRATEHSNPSTSSKPPVKAADYRNNGSSGFDVLFAEELAEEDIEECMLLASQVQINVFLLLMFPVQVYESLNSFSVSGNFGKSNCSCCSGFLLLPGL